MSKKLLRKLVGTGKIRQKLENGRISGSKTEFLENFTQVLQAPRSSGSNAANGQGKLDCQFLITRGFFGSIK